jgi:hypothetical protein
MSIKLKGMSRAGDNEKAIVVHFDREPTNEEFMELWDQLKELLGQPSDKEGIQNEIH